MSTLAQRYAAALADVALEEGTADQIKRELAAFASLLAESADLRTFLASPAVSRESKQGAVEKLVARLGAGKTLRNFLLVLVQNRRTSLLPQIQQAYGALVYARMGIAEAQVISVSELSDQQKADLRHILERLTGKRIEARYALDPALIGGAIVRIGSTVYDGSVREQLNRLGAQLASE